MVKIWVVCNYWNLLTICKIISIYWGGKAIKSNKEVRNRVNEQIKVPEVRLINQEGKQLGVLGIREAQKMAEEVSLDLVEIQPNTDPPVVRIMDYGKFLFKQSKDRAVAKKKQKKVKIKEIKFRVATDDNDYGIKLQNIRKFLAEGDKVKVTVWFKGREVSHHELGLELLVKIRDDLLDSGKVEQFPNRLEGKQMVMVVTPKK